MTEQTPSLKASPISPHPHLSSPPHYTLALSQKAKRLLQRWWPGRRISSRFGSQRGASICLSPQSPEGVTTASPQRDPGTVAPFPITRSWVVAKTSAGAQPEEGADIPPLSPGRWHLQQPLAPGTRGTRDTRQLAGSCLLPSHYRQADEYTGRKLNCS